MTKTRKVFKWAAIVLAFPLFGVPLLLAAINAFDQDLKPEAIAFADLSDDDVPDIENGFYSWVGLASPIDENPHALGVKVVAQINGQQPPDSMEVIMDPSILLGPGAIKFKGNVNGLCGRDSHGCLGRYRTKSADLKASLQDNKVLLARYKVLYAYPQFRETIQPRLRAPMFYAPAQTTGLVRAQNALAALDGNVSHAIHQLRDDTRYWHRILEQSRSLISRMIAVAAIHSNSQLVSEIVATMPLDRHSLALASQASQPLTATERDLSKVFRYELGFVIDVTSNIAQYKQEPCPLDSWADCISETLMPTFLFKPNATINLSYARLERLAQLARLSAHEWHERIQVRRKEHDLDNFPFVWHIFYNPVGKILDAIAEPAYEGYSGRVHNLDGFLRLVSLQVEAKRLGIRDSAMQKFLTDSTPELRNPYTGEPMEWDTGARSIYFNGYDEKANDELLSKRIEVRL